MNLRWALTAWGAAVGWGELTRSITELWRRETERFEQFSISFCCLHLQTCHDVAADSSNDSLRWPLFLLTPSSSLICKTWVGNNLHAFPLLALPLWEHFSKRNWWVKTDDKKQTKKPKTNNNNNNKNISFLHLPRVSSFFQLYLQFRVQIFGIWSVAHDPAFSTSEYCPISHVAGLKHLSSGSMQSWSIHLSQPWVNGEFQ